MRKIKLLRTLGIDKIYGFFMVINWLKINKNINYCVNILNTFCELITSAFFIHVDFVQDVH